MIFVWLQFFVCAGLILAAGTQLSRSGDVIAEKTGLGRSWVGLVLLASVTSLPELVTGVSSVTLANVPNIAVGNVLGACVINLTMIVVLDFLHREESVYRRASQGHILSAAFGVILIGFVGFNILLAQQGREAALGHVAFATPIILALYLIAMRIVYRYERQRIAEYTEEVVELYADVSARQAQIRFAQASLVVAAAAMWLPFVGEQLARVMGWHETFVGTLFLSLATTLPEIVVTVTALRIGALDMAIGNLFGSNLFNIAVIAVDDLFFVRGSIFAHVSPLHGLSAASAVMMTGVAIVGLLYRSPTKLLRSVGWASITLFSLYLLNAYVLYLYRE